MSYTITIHSEPVADLVPTESRKADEAAAAVEQMRKLMLDAAPTKGVKDLMSVLALGNRDIKGGKIEPVAKVVARLRAKRG